MSKKSGVYIQHDPNTMTDPAMDALAQATGPAGSSIFWAIIEVLRVAPNYKVRGDKAMISRLAHRFYWDKPAQLSQLDQIISNLTAPSTGLHPLIQTDSEGFWYSQRLIDDSAPMDNLREKQRQAGLKRALQRVGDLTGEHTGEQSKLPTEVSGEVSSKVTSTANKQTSNQVNKQGHRTSPIIAFLEKYGYTFKPTDADRIQAIADDIPAAMLPDVLNAIKAEVAAKAAIQPIQSMGSYALAILDSRAKQFMAKLSVPGTDRVPTTEPAPKFDPATGRGL